jgi:hypothetical protein
MRIGIRDSYGRLVGPVYNDGAVEGTTFTRERRFFPRARVRPDLPLAPTTPVYRIPSAGFLLPWVYDLVAGCSGFRGRVLDGGITGTAEP